MMTGIWTAREGLQVTVIEQNEKTGRKLYITGKGRCNLTNACPPQDLPAAVLSNPRFLYSAFAAFSNQDVMDFFEKAGVPLKTERGDRVFPVSDHSSDIIRALEREFAAAGGTLMLNTRVRELCMDEGQAAGVVTDSGERIRADVVVVACGGLSYPSTGSRGDGYRFAREAGHTVVDPQPSLVPLLTREPYIPELQGLSLRNVTLTIRDGKKKVFEEFGEMMFTHRGITGPLVLTASARLGRLLEKKGSLSAFVDLKPALDEAQLDARILREFQASPNRQFKNVIGVLFPASLTPVMLQLGGIDPELPVRDVKKAQRQSFVRLIKFLPMTIIGTGSFSEAVITRGGVSTKEIIPGTMQSRLVKNLYFVGEVLDVDAVTGGFNLQIAWSTAYLAARAIAAGEHTSGQN